MHATSKRMQHVFATVFLPLTEALVRMNGTASVIVIIVDVLCSLAALLVTMKALVHRSANVDIANVTLFAISRMQLFVVSAMKVPFVYTAVSCINASMYIALLVPLLVLVTPPAGINTEYLPNDKVGVSIAASFVFCETVRSAVFASHHVMAGIPRFFRWLFIDKHQS